MNYELAKKLKDAGFPQDFGWGSWICKHGAEADPNLENFCKCCGDELIRNVTLSELIEACGEKFECLAREDYKCPVFWKAYPKEEYYKGDCMVDCCGYETGDTPEEAVTNLWIELNKHER